MSDGEHSLTARIDDICDRFELALKMDAGARLEEFLDEMSNHPDRPHLLRELLLLDFEFTLRRGSTLNLDELRQRFPNDRELVETVYARSVGNAASSSQVTSAGIPESQVLTELLVQGVPSGGTGVENSRQSNGDFPLPRGYRVLGELGRGGMGVVYKAHQLLTDRMVAIKVIRPEGLVLLEKARKQRLLDRFHGEIKAVAKLDHPNIVNIFEAGDVDGLPFYSMQYVDGTNLSAMARGKPLSGRKAAEYLEPIARALEAAHRQGILHRDIKPHNILIDSVTDQPLLVDFGLAKSAEFDIQMTNAGDFMGSPPFSSPEQLADPSAIDARSDVYSVGATLYFLMTGRPPFQANSLLEIVQQVANDEPISPRRLNPSIDLDLETICLKCLEKDARRRYGSMEQVADELHRFLIDKPIHARPISAAERTLRWCRRNPNVALAGSAAALCLLTVAIVSTLSYWQVSASLEQEALHRRRAEIERKIAIGARAAEALQRAHAEQREREARENLDLARTVVETFLNRVSEDPRLRVRGVESLRHELLQLSQNFYDVFAQRSRDDPMVNLERAQSYGQLASLTAKLGNPSHAIKLYNEALGILDDLHQGNTETHEAREYQLQYLYELGMTYRDIGVSRRAHSALNSAFQRSADLVRTHPIESAYLEALARSHHGLGILALDELAFDKAHAHLTQALELFGQSANEMFDDAAQCHNNLALAYRELNDLASAERHYLAAVELWGKLLSRNTADPDYLINLARGHNNIGVLYRHQRKYVEAERAFQTAMLIREQLAREHPDIHAYQNELAAGHNNIGALHEDQQQFDLALSAYSKAVALCADLVQRNPNVSEYAENLAISQNNLGAISLQQRDYSAAASHLASAANGFRKLGTDYPEVPRYLIHLTASLKNLADLYRETNDPGEHENMLVELLRCRKTIVQRRPGDRRYWLQLTATYEQIIDYYLEHDRFESGRQILVELVEFVQQELPEDSPIDGSAQIFRTIGDKHSALQEFNDALRWYDKAITQAKKGDSNETNRNVLLVLRVRRAQVLELLHQFEPAALEWQAALELGAQADVVHLKLHLAYCVAAPDNVDRVLSLVAETDGFLNEDGKAHFLAARTFARLATILQNDTRIGKERLQQFRVKALQHLQACVRSGVPSVSELRPTLETDEEWILLRGEQTAADFLKSLETQPNPPASDQILEKL
jgi:tetratricopeptide (TPR) repeat protein/predicted Ser/Thr protein kinase